MNFRRWQELQEQVEGLKQRAERAKGAQAQLMKELRKEFRVGTVEEAEKLLADLEREGRARERRAKNSLQRFKERWDSKLKER